MKRALTVCWLAGALASWAGPAASTPAPGDGPAPTSGLTRANLDPAVRPQDDLFRAANGHWLATTEIPADKSGYGIDTVLADRADARVREIAEALAAGRPAAGSADEKVATVWRAFVDEAAIDRAGLAPLAPWRAQIDALHDKADLARLLGRWQGSVSGPLGLFVDADAEKPDRYRAIAWQGGLGLPDRDYYLLADPKLVAARTAYRNCLQAWFEAAGEARAADSAARVLALEQRLARAQWSAVANRDPKKTYNPTTLAQLRRSALGFDWAAFLAAAALPAGEAVSIAQPGYAKALAHIVASTPLDTWRLYLRARLMDDAFDVLPAPFRQAGFEFHGRALAGLQAPKPRWQRATAELNTTVGEAVGQAYVARWFPPESKARIQRLVDNLLRAYRESIDAVAWMGAETKLKAQEKLARYTTKIGYPERWRDDAKLVVADGDALGNRLRAGRFEHERNAVRAGQPVDRGEWGMTPQTVNAYYSAGFNEIVFPAAILDAPYFDPAADDAANYGGIGATIGHEISHGFDDEGSRFDARGRLHDWWTAKDRRAFDAVTGRLAEQFDAYEPLPGKKVNGRLTLGENIADLAGLEIALRAYHLSLEGKPAPVIDGETGDQRFFLAYAQSWLGKERDERMLQRLTSNPHAPDEYRVNGAVVNVDGFHDSFSTRPADRMYKPPAARIRLW